MRTDTLFGKNVNVVGNISADLVLESLGNIYVKSRNKALTLDEIIKSLGAGSTEELAQKTIILDSLDLLDSIIIKDGALVYDKNSQTLYIQIDGELIELISVSTNDTRYVKKTGDTMTGQLRIEVPAGKAPLTVNSAILNKNFNAQYLEGLPSSAFALKAKNENISGSWTFSKNTYFKSPVYFQDNTMHYRDSLHAGSVGTPNFASGVGGYGWRIDAKTNTLTIDYIVVRKAIYVYELVINKISATNGSLWVSNSSKVKFAYKLNLITGNDNTFNSWFTSPGDWTGESATQETREIATFLSGMLNNEGFIISSETPPLKTLSGAELSSNVLPAIVGEDFYNFKDLKVIMCTDQVKARNLGSQSSSFSFRLDQVAWEENTGNNGYGAECFHAYRLFSPYFDTEVVFPIVHLQDAQYKYAGDGVSKELVYGTPKYVKTYYKYFGQKVDSYSYLLSTNFYLIQFDIDNLPVFLPGDILRCLKFTGNGIKYYDAVVCNKLNDSYFIILLGNSIMDKTTVITYNDNLLPTTTTETEEVNSEFYNRTGHRSNDIYGMIQEGDDIVLIGHLWDINRQNSLYLTSSDDGAPFIDTMSQVNRPDYSVIYYTPAFETIKLYKGGDFPFTGLYYILKDDAISTGQYAIAYLTDYGVQPDNFYSVALNNPVTQITIWYKDRDGNVKTMLFDDALEDSDSTWILEHKIRLQESAPESIENLNPLSLAYIKSLICAKYGLSNLNNYTVKVLRGYPDQNTLLVLTRDPEDLTTEAGEAFVMEEHNSQNTITNESLIVLEDTHDKSSITSTRTTKARLGHLDGIIDERFGPKKLPTGYGLYGENVYLTGEFILSNGKNVIDFDKDIISLQSGLEMSSQMYLHMMDLLKNLADNTPSYGNLEAAGIFLTKNKLILYGDTVMIITRGDELSGNSAPTALFVDGKIQAKFLSVQQLHSINNFYYNNNLPSIHNPNSSSFTIDNEIFNGYGQVYFYCPIKHTENNSEGKPVYITLVSTVYMREFRSSSNRCWVWCDINGEWVGSSPTYITYKLFDNLSISSYSAFTPLLMAQLDAYTPPADPDAPLTANDIRYNMYIEFTDYISENQLKLWSLHYDGKGNLGGNSLYWDTDGNVTVNGTLYSGSGLIGGFKLYQNYMEAKTAISRSFYITTELVTEGSSTVTKYKVHNGLEQYDSLYINCTFPQGEVFLSGNYNLKMGGAPIRLEPEMARITFYSYLNSRGTPYDCALNPTNRTGTISYKGRGALSGDYLTFDDGTATPSAYVNFSKGGGSWVKDRVPMGALTVLFNLIFIPILNRDYYSFYIRHSDVPVLDNTIRRIFLTFKIFWNAEGNGIIAFNGMNTLEKWLWFREAFSSGRLSINITGTLKAKDTAMTSAYSFDYYNNGNQMPPFDLGTYNDLGGDPASTLMPYRDWPLKPSISNIFIPNEDRFDESYKRCIKKSEFPYQCTVSESGYSLKIDDERTYITVGCPLIAFNTSDDNSLNEGGIMMQIVYNNYDDLYIPYFSGVETQYDDEDASEIETYTATINRSTYLSYVTSFNNRLAAIASMENSTNTEKAQAYATAKTAVESFATAVGDNTTWDPVPSSLSTAYTNTDNALTTAELKANLPDNPSE